MKPRRKSAPTEETAPGKVKPPRLRPGKPALGNEGPETSTPDPSLQIPDTGNDNSIIAPDGTPEPVTKNPPLY